MQTINYFLFSLLRQVLIAAIYQPNVSINKPSVDQLNNDQIQPPVGHQSDIVVDNRPKVTTTDDATHVVSVATNRPDDRINETENESINYVLNMIDRPVVKSEADESQIAVSLPPNHLNEKETAVIESIKT